MSTIDSARRHLLSRPDVKLQKRLMGGRAGIPLLRHRVVLIAHLRRCYADRPTLTPG
ncbi:hypothetical protein [Streptomyces sp. NPDC006510]|uniref:hypothetical protein n=1 Tax=Streptomyces sp. NPDC006510 TaxID=3155600 RepID=UPI0033A2A0CC